MIIQDAEIVFFLLQWIKALTLSLLLKFLPRKLEPWFFLWILFLLRLLYISINLTYSLAWNTAAMFRKSFQLLLDMLDKPQKQTCRIAVLHLPPLLNPFLIKKIYQLSYMFLIFFLFFSFNSMPCSSLVRTKSQSIK